MSRIINTYLPPDRPSGRSNIFVFDCAVDLLMLERVLSSMSERGRGYRTFLHVELYDLQLYLGHLDDRKL